MLPSPSISPAAYGAETFTYVTFPVSARRQQPANVLDDDPVRAEGVDGFDVLGPQAGAGAVLHAAACAREGHVLAGEPAGEDVDVGRGAPVDLGDVAVVRHVGEMVREHPGRGGVELAEPRGVRPEDVIDGHPETTDTGEQLTGPHVAHSCTSR